MVQAFSHFGAPRLFSWLKRSFNRILPFTKILTIVYGSFSEIFGRKKVLLAIIVIFLVGSILCARSTSLEMLVASRTLQGIGGGGLLTLVEVIMTDMIPIAERGAFMGIIALIWATGSVVGNTTIFSSD
jgi:MFS family permease